MFKRLVLVMAIVAIGMNAFAANKASKNITGTVNINTATVSELMLLPNIGKSKAEAIVAYRQAHQFKSPQEVTKVKGIGPKMFSKIQQYVSIDGATTAKKDKPTN